MIETLALRALALFAALLAAFTMAILVAAWPEDAARVLARLALTGLLLRLAWLAWRRPAGRFERARRRLLRLGAVLATPMLQDEYAEVSPSTEVHEALIGDWRRARKADAGLSPAEEALAVRVDEAAARAEAELPAGPVRDLQERAAWQELSHAARELQLGLGAPRPR